MSAPSEPEPPKLGAHEPEPLKPGSPKPEPPDRGDVLAMLAAFGDRRPDQIPENIDSMELAWLVHQIEQRYGWSLDADDEALARMTTVSGAVRVLSDLSSIEAAHG